jgi:hypothetical protein
MSGSSRRAPGLSHLRKWTTEAPSGDWGTKGLQFYTFLEFLH